MSPSGSIRPQDQSLSTVLTAFAVILWVGAVIATGFAIVQGILTALGVAVFLLVVGAAIYWISTGTKNLRLNWDEERIWDSGVRAPSSMQRADLALIRIETSLNRPPEWAFVSRDGTAAMTESCDFTKAQMVQLAADLGVELQDGASLRLP